MSDSKRSLMSNIGRVTVKELVVKFKGNEILDDNNFEVFACYQDLWKTESESRMQQDKT